MRVIENLTYGTLPVQRMALYLPEADTFDVLIWFHGGGLEGGSCKDVPFAEDVTRAGYALVSADYRLYPQARFPEYLQDAALAVRYILSHIREFGKVGRFYVGGSSAGAYLTLMLALDARYFAQAGVNPADITGYVSDSAQITTHYNVLRERGEDPRLERLDTAAALYHLSEQSVFGELLLLWYTEDIPCRPEQNRLFYQSAKRLCPDQRIECVELPGGHTHGSQHRNAAGTFDVVDAFLRFAGETARIQHKKTC